MSSTADAHEESAKSTGSTAETSDQRTLPTWPPRSLDAHQESRRQIIVKELEIDDPEDVDCRDPQDERPRYGDPDLFGLRDRTQSGIHSD